MLCLLTTDDSLGGRHSSNLIEEISKNSKYILGLKSGSVDGGIITTCYGRSDYEVRFTSTGDESNSNIHGIIPVLAKKLAALDKISRDEKNYRLSTTSVIAQGSHGHTPNYATISLTCSYKTEKLGVLLDSKIKTVMKKRESNSKKLDVAVNKIQTRHPVLEEPSDTKFYKLVEDLAKKHEIKIKKHSQLLSSDISNVPIRLPALDGFGPLGNHYRTSKEYILHDSIIERSALLASVVFKCAEK